MTITQTVGTTASAGFWSPQIIGAMITGGVALITGLVVSVFAWRQWRVAKDKLALDLFDRRLKVFQALVKATLDRQEEITQPPVERNIAIGDVEPETNTAKARFAVAYEEATFLFGRDVSDIILRISQHLLAERASHLSISLEREGEFNDLFEAYWTCRKATNAARLDLHRTVRPYMLMDRVAVNHPAKPFRWPWSRTPKP